MKNRDYALAWNIERDFAKLLKEFGVVGKERAAGAFELTLKGVGDGYERARAVFALSLDPTLTGEERPAERPPSLVLPPAPRGETDEQPKGPGEERTSLSGAASASLESLPDSPHWARERFLAAPPVDPEEDPGEELGED